MQEPPPDECVLVNWKEGKKEHYYGSCSNSTGSWDEEETKLGYFPATEDILEHTDPETGQVNPHIVAETYFKDHGVIITPDGLRVGTVWETSHGIVDESCCGTKIQIISAILVDRPRWMECDDSDSEDSDSEEASVSVQNEKILALEKENKALQERVKMLEEKINMILKNMEE